MQMMYSTDYSLLHSCNRQTRVIISFTAAPQPVDDAYKLTKMLYGVFVLMTAAYILPGTQAQLLRKLRAFLL